MPISRTSDTVELTLGQFSSASIALKGATLFSYQQSGLERLFTSSISSTSTSDPAAIRGGVPICFPIFGPPPQGNELYSKLKQHGFARTSVWDYVEEESKCDGEKGVKAVFSTLHSPPFFLPSDPTNGELNVELEPTPSIQSLFSLPFLLHYTVSLTPSGLSLSLRVTSPSSSIAPLPFQALLHSYFRLPQTVLPPQVLVTPLENLSYLDKVQGNKEELIERRKIVNVDGPKGEVDRVYLRAPDKLRLSYEGQPGSVELHKKNLADVVVRFLLPFRLGSGAPSTDPGRVRY